MDEVCAELGLTYTIRTAGIDEKAIRDPVPSKLVSLLAKAKKVRPP
jgi:hypothetical protein